MAGNKTPGMALGVLLAVAALLAVAVRAVDDDHMYHWKCFKSCTGNCRDDDVVAKEGNHSADWNAVPGGGKCKDKCLNECFVEDLPAHCYHQCVVTNCLRFPPFSKERTTCLKSCCDKCFHPPAPGPAPKPPCPPKPKPPPCPPKPKPKPPTPSAPLPPAPTKPKPKPPPKPPTPKPPKPPTPKPKPPKPPTPKPKPPPPKKPCPCPPGSDEVKADNNN